jgi:beta-mannosidase
VSWSLVDYDGVGKASFYAVTRVYAPVLASFKQLDDGAVELWITNDTLQSVSGDAVLELIRFAGGMDWNETVAFEVAANSSVAVWKGRVPAMTADRALCVRSDKATFAENRHFFGAIKDLQLVPAAKPGVSFAQVDANTIDVHLSAEAYLLFVSLECERAGPRFSDNYFDLRPGDARTIRVSDAQRAISSEDLTIRCWNQRLIH